MSPTKKRSENPEELREQVKAGYGRIARASGTGGECGCGCAPSGVADHAKGIGYRDDQLAAVPEGANLGLGCGNPTAIATLQPGEVVVDLGSGAGFDAFLAAREVGETGRVIGVDMTDEMLEKARTNAEAGGFRNVEFRKGNIEALPVDDESVDAIISNCVINLSPEKERVFNEAHRVLRSGGRLMISDIVLEKPLPEAVTASLDAYLGCVAGASLRTEYVDLIREAGFSHVEITAERNFAGSEVAWLDEVAAQLGLDAAAAREALDAITSLSLLARK
jgi:SAM-dependent methyltransferase